MVDQFLILSILVTSNENLFFLALPALARPHVFLSVSDANALAEMR